jgi:DNA-binding GntR family transcriptional regulator
LYGLVYGFAATKALERSPDALSEKLAQLAADFARADDPREAQRIAVTFHAAVVDAAASPRIDVVVRALSALVPGDFYELVPDAVTLQRSVSTRSHGRASGATARLLRLPTPR